MTLIQALDVLKELSEDSAVPRKIRATITTTVSGLEKQSGAMQIAKAVEQLETISENINIEPFVRTEIFNVVSLLEIAQK